MKEGIKENPYGLSLYPGATISSTDKTNKASLESAENLKKKTTGSKFNPAEYQRISIPEVTSGVSFEGSQSNTISSESSEEVRRDMQRRRMGAKKRSSRLINYKYGSGVRSQDLDEKIT